MPTRKYATEEERQAARRAKQKIYTQRYAEKYPGRVEGLSRQYHAKERKRDPEKYRKRGQAQYQKNRAKRLADAKVYAEQHREERLAYNDKRYKRLNEAKWLEKAARRLLDPAKEAQRAAQRLWEAQRRARKKGLPDTFSTEQRTHMYSYWGYACAICGNQEGFSWTLADDHWIPLNDPVCPGTVVTNMVPLCHGKGGCNNRKRYSEPHAWLLRRYSLQKARAIERRIASYFAEVRGRVGHEHAPLL